MLKSMMLLVGALTSPPPAVSDQAPAAAQSETGEPAAIVRRDTPLELMATKEVSTANVTAGTKFRLRLNKPVIVNEKVTIPVGTWVHGEVISASDSGGLGKSGEMQARLLYLEFGSNQIPVDGQVSAKGTGAGSAGAAIIFAGVAGLFHRGNNAKIKAGELINAFVAEDTKLVLP